MKILAEIFATAQAHKARAVLHTAAVASRPVATFCQLAEPRRQTVAPFYQTAGLFCHLAERFRQTVKPFRRLAESFCQLAELLCQAAFTSKNTSFPLR